MLVRVLMRDDESTDLRRSRQAMSHRGAHNQLVRLRQAMAPDGRTSDPQEWVRSLSDESEFEWKTYVAFHPDCDAIVGPSIQEFGAVFVRAWDRNMDQPRMDFVVSRTDDTVVRLHPSSKQHGVPLYDNSIANWLTPPAEQELWKLGFHGTRAAMPGSALVRSSEGFHAVHQQDVIGRSQACTYLERKWELWQARHREKGGDGMPVSQHRARGGDRRGWAGQAHEARAVVSRGT